MKNLAIVALLLAGSIVPAIAQEEAQTECQKYWVEYSLALHMHHVATVELTPAQRGIVTENYNNTEPKTNESFPHIFTAKVNDQVGVFFVSEGGCAKAVKLDVEKFAELLSPHNGL